MKQLLIFIKKEFYHILRDKRTILILLVMPVIQIILFGFAITTEVKNTKLAVCDPSKDISTQAIIERIKASEYFNIVEYIHNPDEISKILKEGKLNMIIVFGGEFHDNLLHTGDARIQLIADAADPNQALIASNYLTNIIMSYQQDIMQAYKPPVQINTEIRMLYNPQMKSAYNFVPGVMGLIMMLICAMMTAIAIVREKEMGTMEVLLASPIKPIYIILAKLVPYFFLSIVNLITILLMSVFVLNMPIAGNLLTLIFISLLFILVALSLGLLISNIVNNQVAAMLISGMGFMMPTMLLSGMMFPVENMPEILQWLSSIVPARWYISAVRKLMIQGVDFIFIIKEFLILAFMALALVTISLKKFKIRLV
jgi:ABC-2 type transport system permease protein